MDQKRINEFNKQAGINFDAHWTAIDKALYSRVKSEAKRKFKVYPSAYANAWLVRTYKKRGGRYRKGK